MLILEFTKIFNNQLEPQSLIDIFIKNPPENFKIEVINPYLPAFSTNFNLLTTIDESLLKFVDKLTSFFPFNYINNKILTPKVTFIGTTVSEYCILPNNVTPKELSDSLSSYISEHNKNYFIVKDIPLNSPLLSIKDNDFSKELIIYLEKCGFETLAGQALAYLPIDFKSLDEYLMRFSSKRRYDFRKKLKSIKNIKLTEYNTGDEFFTNEVIGELYKLYLNVYEGSYINFDKLTLPFFKQLFQNTDSGKVFIYKDHNKILGFNLCFIFNNKLIDKYCGYLYPEARDFQLFFNHFFDNINYCIRNDLNTYVMGWTAPKVKAYLGCYFTFTYHAVYIKNPVFKYLLKKLKYWFEFDRNILIHSQ